MIRSRWEIMSWADHDHKQSGFLAHICWRVVIMSTKIQEKTWRKNDPKVSHWFGSYVDYVMCSAGAGRNRRLERAVVCVQYLLVLAWLVILLYSTVAMVVPTNHLCDVCWRLVVVEVCLKYLIVLQFMLWRRRFVFRTDIFVLIFQMFERMNFVIFFSDIPFQVLASESRCFVPH